MPQLEFRWVSWLRVRAAQRPLQEPSMHEDCGLTAWCVETSKLLNLSELSRRVRVSWNPRMRTTAGRAWWPDRMIELNPKLKTLPPEELWRTLKHELAHLVAYERAGRHPTGPHGPEWQAACAELGIPNEQPYHTLPFKSRKMKRNYSYVCPHCLSTMRRVKPIRRMVACYACCRKYNNGSYHTRFRLVEQKH